MSCWCCTFAQILYACGGASTRCGWSQPEPSTCSIFGGSCGMCWGGWRCMGKIWWTIEQITAIATWEALRPGSGGWERPHWALLSTRYLVMHHQLSGYLFEGKLEWLMDVIDEMWVSCHFHNYPLYLIEYRSPPQVLPSNEATIPDTDSIPDMPSNMRFPSPIDMDALQDQPSLELPPKQCCGIKITLPAGRQVPVPMCHSIALYAHQLSHVYGDTISHTICKQNTQQSP